MAKLAQTKTDIFAIVWVCLWLSACGQTPQPLTDDATSTSSAVPGATEPAVRVIFSNTNFTSIDTFNPTPALYYQTQYQCPGDVLKVYSAQGGDYSSSGTAIAFPTPIATIVDDLGPTTKPAFLKHVAVDITNTYYVDSVVSTIQSDPCSFRAVPSAPQSSYCADFDRAPFWYLAYNSGTFSQAIAGSTPTPAPQIATTTPTPTPVPTSTPFFGTNYYRVRDDFCQYQGPVISTDVEATKTNVGGVNIDLDRGSLGANEDLLMNITYHAFNSTDGSTTRTSEWPLPTGIMGQNDHTVLSVQMVGTGQSLDSLLGVKQPRAWNYYQSASYPIYAKDISTFDDPYAGIRTEQVYIPLSQNPLIDRIRIERTRGTYILYEVDLYRLGERSVSAQ